MFDAGLEDSALSVHRIDSPLLGLPAPPDHVVFTLLVLIVFTTRKRKGPFIVEAKVKTSFNLCCCFFLWSSNYRILLECILVSFDVCRFFFDCSCFRSIWTSPCGLVKPGINSTIAIAQIIAWTISCIVIAIVGPNSNECVLLCTVQPIIPLLVHAIAIACVNGSL